MRQLDGLRIGSRQIHHLLYPDISNLEFAEGISDTFTGVPSRIARGMNHAVSARSERAHVEEGRMYVRVKDMRTLVMNDIYRYDRHPAYLGLNLHFLGIPILFSIVLSLLLMLLLVSYFLHQINLEVYQSLRRFL